MSEKNNDLISIITPSYGSEKFIAQTIESVINQSYIYWEMIIVDDVSLDHSNKIIEKYIEKDSRIKLIKLEKNSGPAVARNRAIQEAEGRFIAFLDSDDLWLPEKLEKQITHMKSKDLAFSFADYHLIDEKNNSLGTFISSSMITYYSMLKTCSVGCLTAIYDTHKIGKIYMPNVYKREDYALWLKILKKIKVAEKTTGILGVYRIHSQSVSSNKRKVAWGQWKVYREIERLNWFQSFYYFVHYTINGILKYR